MSNLLNIKDQSGNWIPIPVVTNGIKSITQNQDYTLTITLNDGTAYTTTSIKGEDGQDYVLTEQDKQEIAGFVDTPVDDVQINGQSIVENGVANIPYGSNDNYGLLKASSTNGIFASGGVLSINNASESDIKGGTEELKPLTPNREHMAIFYGLAKASGDTTQSQSDNEVGVYTDEAKASIKNMLGVEDVDIDSKAPVITETVSDDIVSFDDGADDMPLQSLVVNIEPVQDLHGYDSPWPAGGGKNLFDSTLLKDQASWNIIPLKVKPDTVYTMSTDKSSNELYLYFNNVEGGGGGSSKVVHVNQPVTITSTSDGYVYISQRRVSGEDSFQNYHYQVEEGSTATDWTPYENICPISGWTGCEVQRTGKNIFGGEAFKDAVLANVSTATAGEDENGKYVSFPAGAASNEKVLFEYPWKENTVYTFIYRYKKNTTNGITNLSIKYKDGTYNYLARNGGVEADTVYTEVLKSSKNKLISDVRAIWGNGTATIYYDDFGVFEGDISVNDFVPYTGQTYPITFPTEAGTVYGGYIDPINGELVADRAIVDLGTLNLRKDTDASITNYLYYATLPDRLPYYANNGAPVFLKCSALKPIKIAMVYSGLKTLEVNTVAIRVTYTNYVCIKSEIDTVEAMKQSLDGVQLVYPLAEPIHYPITAIDIKTLLGTNNIWADTGDVSVEYRADTELYINKQIPDVPVDDVQIDSTSIVTDGVANIPVGGNDLGVVKENLAYGIDITGLGQLLLITPSDIELKKGYSGSRRAIMTLNQHIAAFYGLAKAAGDTTQSSSSNAVGTYTDSAKTAIKNMLGVIDGGGTISETITGTDPTITAQNNFRYMCGELYTLNFTPCVSGVCEVIFTSGATPTVLTLPDTVRMPAWWTGVEANTTYEISIVDGVYGAVMSWS